MCVCVCVCVCEQGRIEFSPEVCVNSCQCAIINVGMVYGAEHMPLRHSLLNRHSACHSSLHYTWKKGGVLEEVGIYCTEHYAGGLCVCVCVCVCSYVDVETETMR